MNKKWLLPGLFVLSFMIRPPAVHASSYVCEVVHAACMYVTDNDPRCFKLAEACEHIFS